MFQNLGCAADGFNACIPFKYPNPRKFAKRNPRGHASFCASAIRHPNAWNFYRQALLEATCIPSLADMVEAWATAYVNAYMDSRNCTGCSRCGPARLKT